MEFLDCRGLKCPLPVLKTQKRLERVDKGEALTVLADDPLAPLDLQHWCNTSGHQLTEKSGDAQQGWRFVIVK
ncbi:sulfurtransferase TusA family protein [Aureimonas fodinaquatilis]|uniref:Sulfurtransferase TusA family protein n=1 Tax=Aureimonas fodinaquatilis TaxID=2565783 RepID=A0A5B0DYV9_9HYPH|nr:sulfurtransferase TusA family protein [Aureimonas fodinaquatilis]KAA0971568.1 sulfurtransferase TusA family protein [Aureimonas fodinaquatilis]